MLKTVEEATAIIRKNLPNGHIQSVIPYRDLYLFMVFRDTPLEEEVDPFYSVHQQNGAFKEFSILTDGNMSEILSLFKKEVSK